VKKRNGINTKAPSRFLQRDRASFMLTDKDSNLEKQNQKLLCYHYTIGQCLLFAGAKIMEIQKLQAAT
jgi:hypothetical protein